MNTGLLFLVLSVAGAVAIGYAHEALRARRRRADVIDLNRHRVMREHPSNVRVLRERAK